MDNPSYFQSQCPPTNPQEPLIHEPMVQEQDLYATFKVDDIEALKNLDDNFNELSSRLDQSEPPSVKLMKKCSLRRLLTQKPKWTPAGLELKRSQRYHPYNM